MSDYTITAGIILGILVVLVIVYFYGDDNYEDGGW